jgi:RNA polymerase sigma-70 factor, ECF subfamily
MTSSPPTTAPDDATLVHLSRQGDVAAYEQLVTRHERRIYHLARRVKGSVEDAQDVTQQAFISASKNLDRFSETAAFTT